MHLVIPFAAALTDAATQAIGTLALPHLERLAGRWVADPAPAEEADADEYTLSMPHERVLAALRGWPVADGLLPFAAEAARADGLDIAPGSGWGLVTPTHWHVGREEIHLLDPAALELDAAEARTLFDTLAPLFTESGWQWHWAAPTRWYAGHPSLAALPTASLDRVIGRHVDLCLDDRPDLLTVRRFQSEAQMLLYTHPLNDAREARGLRPVNSFWLSATGPATAGTLAPDVVVDDRLRAPALADDWSAWAEAWHAIDAGPLRALAESKDAGAALTLCGERQARTWRAGSRPWWKALFGGGASAAPLLQAL